MVSDDGDMNRISFINLKKIQKWLLQSVTTSSTCMTNRRVKFKELFKYIPYQFPYSSYTCCQKT